MIGAPLRLVAQARCLPVPFTTGPARCALIGHICSAPQRGTSYHSLAYSRSLHGCSSRAATAERDAAATAAAEPGRAEPHPFVVLGGDAVLQVGCRGLFIRKGSVML